MFGSLLNMKGNGVYKGIFALLLLGLFIVPLVSAARIIDSINSGIDSGVSGASPILSKLLGETPNGEWLFAKVLFFIIVFSVIWLSLDRIEFFSSKTWALALITSAVSLLATRWIASEALVNTLILPYSALGIAISAALPFILYAIVLEKGFEGPDHRITRRIGWIFFAVIFIGLWFTRDGLGGSPAPYIYPVTAALAIGMMFIDGTIQRFLRNMEMQKVGAANTEEAVTSLKEKISKLPDLVTEDVITAEEAARRKKKYLAKIDFLSK